MSDELSGLQPGDVEELIEALRGNDYGPLKDTLANLLEFTADCHDHMCQAHHSASCLAGPLRLEARKIRALLARIDAARGKGEHHAD